jgi:hypothetical protein
VTLDPPPTRPRSCPHCRRPIAVRRWEGRIILLSEDAVPVFDALRKEEQDLERWTAQRHSWLTAAATAGADPNRRAKLMATDLSQDVVDASRKLYVDAAETAARLARREHRWHDLVRIRRTQAATIHADEGRPIPASEEVLALQREAMLARLRELGTASKMAELVSSGCCAICRREEDHSFPIAAELREPRLPHVDCKKGLCGCDWWISTAKPKKPRRRKVVAEPAAATTVVGTEPATAETDPPVAEPEVEAVDPSSETAQDAPD